MSSVEISPLVSRSWVIIKSSTPGTKLDRLYPGNSVGVIRRDDIPLVSLNCPVEKKKNSEFSMPRSILTGISTLKRVITVKDLKSELNRTINTNDSVCEQEIIDKPHDIVKTVVNQEILSDNCGKKDVTVCSSELINIGKNCSSIQNNTIIEKALEPIKKIGLFKQSELDLSSELLNILNSPTVSLDGEAKKDKEISQLYPTLSKESLGKVDNLDILKGKGIIFNQTNINSNKTLNEKTCKLNDKHSIETQESVGSVKSSSSVTNNNILSASKLVVMNENISTIDAKIQDDKILCDYQAEVPVSKFMENYLKHIKPEHYISQYNLFPKDLKSFYKEKSNYLASNSSQNYPFSVSQSKDNNLNSNSNDYLYMNKNSEPDNTTAKTDLNRLSNSENSNNVDLSKLNVNIRVNKLNKKESQKKIREKQIEEHFSNTGSTSYTEEIVNSTLGSDNCTKSENDKKNTSHLESIAEVITTETVSTTVESIIPVDIHGNRLSEEESRLRKAMESVLINVPVKTSRKSNTKKTKRERLA